MTMNIKKINIGLLSGNTMIKLRSTPTCFMWIDIQLFIIEYLNNTEHEFNLILHSYLLLESVVKNCSFPLQLS